MGITSSRLKISSDSAQQIATKTAKYWLNQIQRQVVYLFLLSPPLSGSTAIAQLLRTSPHVAVFPGNNEGQFLPEAESHLLVDDRWDPQLAVDWPAVKRIFQSYWSPFKPIKFEKSPPNLARASDLEKIFQPAYFLVTIRNPYAQIEGLLRREWPFGAYGPQTTAAPPATPKTAAEFWVRSAQYQRQNLAQLERTLFFSYEQLTEHTEQVMQNVIDFVPAIATVNLQAKLDAHNITGAPIQGLKNLNASKIKQLTPRQIEEINTVLSQHQELMDFFQYPILSAPNQS